MELQDLIPFRPVRLTRHKRCISGEFITPVATLAFERLFHFRTSDCDSVPALVNLRRMVNRTPGSSAGSRHLPDSSPDWTSVIQCKSVPLGIVSGRTPLNPLRPAVRLSGSHCRLFRGGIVLGGRPSGVRNDLHGFWNRARRFSGNSILVMCPDFRQCRSTIPPDCGVPESKDIQLQSVPPATAGAITQATCFLQMASWLRPRFRSSPAIW